MYKIDRREGGRGGGAQKSFSRKFPKNVKNYSSNESKQRSLNEPKIEQILKILQMNLQGKLKYSSNESISYPFCLFELYFAHLNYFLAHSNYFFAHLNYLFFAHLNYFFAHLNYFFARLNYFFARLNYFWLI